MKLKNKREKFTTILLSFIIFIGMIATYKLLNNKKYYESYNPRDTIQNTTYTQISDISTEKSHNSEISKYDFKETTSINFYKGFEKTFKTPTTIITTPIETTTTTSSITNCETVLNTIEQSNIIQPITQQTIIEQPTVAYIEPIINTTIQTTQVVAVGYKPVDKLSIDLQNHIYNLCVENGVSFSIIMSIIEKESGFNASASNGVCIGLMQLHSAYNSGDLYDAYHNTELGIKLIGRLVTNYGLEQGLVYYNCGEYSGVYAPTSYSNSVISNSKKYE